MSTTKKMGMTDKDLCAGIEGQIECVTYNPNSDLYMVHFEPGHCEPGSVKLIVERLASMGYAVKDDLQYARPEIQRFLVAAKP